MSPLIPGLNDADIPEILTRAQAAGARRAFMIPIRLPREVLPVFEERLRAAFPNRALKVMNAIREMRGGSMNEGRFGARMRGIGARWQVIEGLFESTCRRLGIDQRPCSDSAPDPFHRPEQERSFFDD